MKAEKYYSNKLEKLSKDIYKEKKKLTLNAWSRGLTFSLGTIITFLSFKYLNLYFGYSSVLFFLILLIYFVKKSSIIHQKIKFLYILSDLNKAELKALNKDFSSFYEGKEFIDPKHDFSFDLDIFGKNSIFQMLNRSFTNKGKTLMAEKLKKPLTDISEISQRQKAVDELTKNINFIQDFLAKAKISSLEEKKSETKNSNATNTFQNKFSSNSWKIILIILPILSFSIIFLISFNILSAKFLYLYSLIILSIVGIFIKYINKIHNNLTKQAKIYKRYSELLQSIENKTFESDKLKTLQQNLKSNGQKASKILKKYYQLLTALDNRLNFIFAFIFDTLVLWDIQVVRRIEIHNSKYMQNFDSWTDTIAEFETYCSLAIFHFNNPQYCFAHFNSKFDFTAKNLGHPIIPSQKLVSNDFSFSKQTRTFIITGANMAGKSTFLRTIGVNFILAQIGSVVCAEEITIHPMNIITSIRITDSLASDESYFYAELKRLQYIVNKINKTQNILIIIDEMLRGTNSNDKHKGSEALLEKLTKKNVVSFLATHDVALGDLEKRFPGKVKNYCFEAEIKNNELFFDYKIRQGISQNLNASFLMKKMKIID